MVHPVDSSPPTWDYRVVLDCLTNERLSSYLEVMDHDVRQAFHLYEWNMRAAASVLTLTSMAEVVVRNALDKELSAWARRRRHGAEWFDVDFLDRRGHLDLQKARRRARSRHDEEVHGKVVAELSLGFWRYLVESRYYTALWVPATHAAFPLGAPDLRERQRDVALRMKRLTFVRNRAAHHEPLHQRDLHKDLNAALDLTCWISPDAGSWIQARNDIADVAQRKPSPLL